MSKPFKVSEKGAPSAGTPKLPGTAQPTPPVREVFDQAIKTGRGLDQIAHEESTKAEPRCIPWGPDKPLEGGGKPFKV